LFILNIGISPNWPIKDKHKVEHNTIFKTHVFIYALCEISYGRGFQTQKPKRLSPTPYSWVIRKCSQSKFSTWLSDNIDKNFQPCQCVML